MIKSLKQIYEKKNYEFEFDEKKILKLINNWKKNSIKFTQYSILEPKNLINIANEIYLREIKLFYSYNDKKKTPILNKYAIWIDDLNISHIRQSKHLFIDGTWYKPNGYEQIFIIILYKDIIIEEKIPWMLYYNE